LDGGCFPAAPAFTGHLFCGCGWGLASLERTGEIQQNDQVIVSIMEDYTSYNSQTQAERTAIQILVETCVNSTSDFILNTNISDANTTCRTTLDTTLNELFPLVDRFQYFDNVRFEDMVNAISFDWIVCEDNDTPIEIITDFERRGRNQQGAAYVRAFASNWREQYTKLRRPQSTTTEEEEYPSEILQALYLATGSSTCRTHVAGGALFWFTIMTTIGYGNTAPATASGRAIVFVLGFLSIIAFLALNGSAARIVAVMVEDWLAQHRRMQHFTKGLYACLFWFILLVAWTWIFAAIAMAPSQEACSDSTTGDCTKMMEDLGDGKWKRLLSYSLDFYFISFQVVLYGFCRLLGDTLTLTFF
jgi:hypothetical protein